ncbi:Hypothetical protein PHPALM_5658, partial [Phytophthora palmivora]
MAARSPAPLEPPPPPGPPPSAAATSWLEPPALAAVQGPPCDELRPGRAGGMLPVLAAPGAALVAATARALGVPRATSDLHYDSSDDEDGQDDHAAAASGFQAPTRLDEVQQVLALPGRAGSMLPDPASVCPSPVAATAAAIPAPAVAVSQEAPAAVRAAVEHHVHAQPSQEPTSPARVLVEPMLVDACSSKDSTTPMTSNDPVQATYAHDAAQFECALCAYVADSMDTTDNRGTRFQDTFTSGCACNLVFYARIVAASHASACGKRRPRAVPPAPVHHSL